MHPAHFDAWTRSVRSSLVASSRRSLVLSALSVLLTNEPVAARGRCLKKGAKCDPGKPSKCCSCRCEEQGAGFRCGPIDFAGGCTGATNSCTGSVVGCPDIPPGDGSCVVTADGQPFCANRFVCVKCTTDKDCQHKGHGVRHAKFGRCVPQCPNTCGATSVSACVYPYTCFRRI
jgi:hypothetical protein